jgi:two-component system, cell cycle response regulator
MRQFILLIDDSEAVHALVRASLEDEPVAVESAYDGESGAALAMKFRPDLVLVDVDMPGIDGFEVCRRLSNEVRTANIPVIFLTAAGAAELKVRGLDLGATDYITKPFNPPEFAARIRAALRTKSRADTMRSQFVQDFIAGALKSPRRNREAA